MDIKDRKINLGIMATGKIVRKVIQTLKQLDCLNLYAVASRSAEKAEAFASEYGISKAFSCYQAMVQDPEVDLVWIATPHSEHLNCIKLCAENGKNIICEKAFTINAKQAEEAFEICRRNNVFITEAIWCRFAPMAKTIKDIVNSGKLGKILNVSTNLCYNTWHRERVCANRLGGGALLDVGVYCLNFIDLILNDEITGFQIKSDIDDIEKTDKTDHVILSYKNGVTADFYCSCMFCSDRLGTINGENGFAVVENINNYDSISIYDNSRSGIPVEVIKAPARISGYEYEFEESCKAILNGKKETEFAPHSQTLRIMNQMDRLRKEIGLVYDCEK